VSAAAADRRAVLDALDKVTSSAALGSGER
jgi:hypothetical protein